MISILCCGFCSLIIAKNRDFDHTFGFSIAQLLVAKSIFVLIIAYKRTFVNPFTYVTLFLIIILTKDVK